MKIYDIAKVLSGNVLGIGVDDEIRWILEKNNRVTTCNLLNSKSSGNCAIGNDKKKRIKKIRIKKLRKIFKRKKVDFILCDVSEVTRYLKTFIKDSVFINKNILYIYNIYDIDIKDELIKKYGRYNTSIEEIRDGNSVILKIDNKNSKTNFFKDVFYLIIDTFFQILNVISDLLLN
jgi:hypothetical protein